MAFRGDSTDTYTYASGSTGGTVDLGARNNYRYVNASNVYNKGKADGVTTPTITLVKQQTKSTSGDIGSVTCTMTFDVPVGVKFICISTSTNVPSQSVTNASLIGSQYTGSGAARIGIYNSTAASHTVTGTATTWGLTHFVFSVT